MLGGTDETLLEGAGTLLQSFISKPISQAAHTAPLQAQTMPRASLIATVVYFPTSHRTLLFASRGWAGRGHGTATATLSPDPEAFG